MMGWFLGRPETFGALIVDNTHTIPTLDRSAYLDRLYPAPILHTNERIFTV